MLLIRVLAPAVLIVLFAAGVARAEEPTKEQCFDASETGQKLRRDGELVAARARMITCASEACPELVRADCVERLAEIDRALPAILFDVNDTAGHDVAGVRIAVDGGPLEARSGRPMPIDPGEHAFVFERPGGERVERRLVILEGETHRREMVTFSAPAPPPAAGVARVSPARAGGGEAQRALGVASGAVGVVAVGIGAVLGLRAGAKWDDAKSACGAGCAPGSAAYALRDDASGAATASTIGFVVGGAALVAGAILWLTAPSARAPIVADRSGVAIGARF